MPDLDFCAGTKNFIHPLIRHTLEKNLQNLKIFERDPQLYTQLSTSKFFDLSHESASKKFVITDCSVLTDSAFSFAFSLLLFSVWFSLLHKVSVAVVDVPKCWLCLCHG